MNADNVKAYFDYAAASPVDERVIEVMLNCLRRHGNPSSMNTAGNYARNILETSRAQVARLVGSESKDEIFFTSCPTESNNLAIRGYALRNKERGNHIITTKIEHMSVLNVCKSLEKEGFSVTYLPVDSAGMVSAESVRNAVTGKTILITMACANGEIGTIQPYREICDFARSRDIAVHLDGTAAVGKIPINVALENIDLLTIPSNDIYGPQGVGALFIRKGTRVFPQIIGGGQERGMRSGTENIAGIAGFGKAAELALIEMNDNIRHMQNLRDEIISSLLRIPHSHLNGHPEKRLPNNVNIRFDYIEGESIVLSLDMEGISAATSSACSSKTLEPSHVLLAMGISHADSQGALLLTLGKYNTMNDVQYITEKLPDIVNRLRSMSPIASHPELLNVAYEKETEEHTDGHDDR